MPSIMDGLGAPDGPPEISKTPPPAAPVTMRDFGDAPALRSAIYDRVLEAARTVQPESNPSHSIELRDVDWHDPPDIPLAEHKKAILEGRSLTRRLKGTWVLKDAAGEPIATRTTTIAHVPHLTRHGTFVINGSEYTLGNQLRLRSGVFTRQKDNGEIEAHVAALPGKGVSHRHFLEPDTGIFKFQLGQSSMPTFTLLKAMGASDQEIRDAWGNDLAASNSLKDDPRTIDKLYMRLGGRAATPSDPYAQKVETVVKAISGIGLDPEVTARTLGHPHTQLTKEALLATTGKLLAISRGEAETDDRDHLAYQQFLGPEDLMAERIGKDRSVLRGLLWKATFNARKGAPADALRHAGPGVFTGPVQASILSSGIGQAVEEVNSADVLDQQARVSRLGYGGISSVDSIPADSRSVQPSHLNFIDLLRTPECYDAETEVMTQGGWKPWPAVVAGDKLACLVDGRVEFHRPEHLVATEYDGPLYGAKTTYIDYLVTPNHRMWVQPCDVRTKDPYWRIETAEEMYKKTRRLLCGGVLPAAGRIQPGTLTAAQVRKLRQIPYPFFQADPDARWKLFLELVAEGGRELCYTRSAALLGDLERLAFGLGLSVRRRKDRSNHLLAVMVETVRVVYPKNQFTTHYRGRVYCAQVPGGLLHVRRHGCVGFWCGNSFKAGVDSRVGYAVRKGNDRRLYAPFTDVKTGERVYRSPQDVADAVVAFPGELERAAKAPPGDQPLVAAMTHGKVKLVPPGQVDLAMPHMEQAFSPINNMVPLKSALKGQRAAMASRFITQALPLKDAEAPLVRTASSRSRSCTDRTWGPSRRRGRGGWRPSRRTGSRSSTRTATLKHTNYITIFPTIERPTFTRRRPSSPATPSPLASSWPPRTTRTRPGPWPWGSTSVRPTFHFAD